MLLLKLLVIPLELVVVAVIVDGAVEQPLRVLPIRVDWEYIQPEPAGVAPGVAHHHIPSIITGVRFPCGGTISDDMYSLPQ